MKIGDRVKVINADGGGNQIKHLGDIGVIREIVDCNYPGAKVEFPSGDIISFLEKRLQPVFNNKEALHAAIDGATLINERGTKLFMEDDVFYVEGPMFERGTLGDYLKMRPNSQWMVYVPQPAPKFTKGSFFTTSSGKLGKVLNDPEYVNEGYKYTVRFDFKNKQSVSYYPEESMYEYEEE